MLERIDRRVDARCMTETMNKQGCCVDTDGAPVPHRVIDMDHATAPVDSGARKCDFLVFAEEAGRPGILAAALELKNTGLNAATVGSQLQAGARAVEQVVRGIAPVRFVPVAVHGGRVHRRQFQVLRRMRIRFRNAGYEVMIMPCDLPVSAALP